MLLLFISTLLQILNIFLKILCGLFCFKGTAVMWHGGGIRGDRN